MSGKDIDFSEMRDTAEAVFEEAYGPDPVGQAYLLKLQIIRQMEAFLKRYQMPLILGMECEVLHLEHRLEATVPPFRYTGIIDRIEKRDGIDCILDYKTGSSANRLKIDFGRLEVDDRASWNEAIGSLQLPLYLFLYERVSGLARTGWVPCSCSSGRSAWTRASSFPFSAPVTTLSRATRRQGRSSSP